VGEREREKVVTERERLAGVYSPVVRNADVAAAAGDSHDA
jgi:hypothetical protein